MISPFAQHSEKPPLQPRVLLVGLLSSNLPNLMTHAGWPWARTKKIVVVSFLSGSGSIRRKIKDGRLNLESIDLVEIPCAVDHEEQSGEQCTIQRLLLSMNNISNISTGIFANRMYEALQHLDLSHNLIKSLPDDICQLSRTLHTLNLAGNQLDTQSLQPISKLTALQSLNLSNNGITALHEDLGSLSSLEDLNLNYNKLSALPNGFTTNLSRLRHLQLYANDFKVFPLDYPPLFALSSLFNSLMRLDFGSNMIPNLPSGLREQCPALVITAALPDKVCDGLFIGDYDTSNNKAALLHHGITHVLTLISDGVATYPHLFAYHIVRIHDSHTQDIAATFESCNNFIRGALKERNGEKRGEGGEGGVLVHCECGVSRSSTVVIAYLMEEHCLSLDDAIVR